MAALQFVPGLGVQPATDAVFDTTGNYGFPDGAIPADPRMFRLVSPEPEPKPEPAPQPRRGQRDQAQVTQPVSLAKIQADLRRRRKHVESTIKRLRAELVSLENESRDISAILEPKPPAQLALVTKA
jgi:hypothetical protein